MNFSHIQDIFCNEITNDCFLKVYIFHINVGLFFMIISDSTHNAVHLPIDNGSSPFCPHFFPTLTEWCSSALVFSILSSSHLLMPIPPSTPTFKEPNLTVLPNVLNLSTIKLTCNFARNNNAPLWHQHATLSLTSHRSNENPAPTNNLAPECLTLHEYFHINICTVNVLMHKQATLKTQRCV